MNFKYLGLDLCQQEPEIMISQNSYIEPLQNISLSSKPNLKKHLKSQESRGMRGLLGKLSWIGWHKTLDLCFDVCNISVNIKK